MTTTFAQPPVSFRRDRFGECWHLIPGGELGSRTRALCGQPRQGTALSEAYAVVEPAEPECLCAACIEAYARLAAREVPISQAPSPHVTTHINSG